MRKVEEVALYAILLRETADNHHTGPQSLLDDFECCRDYVTFATMLAHEHFTELDWQLVEVLIDHSSEVPEIARVLYGEQEQPLEAEALMHALGPNGKKSRAKWFEPFRGDRWDYVRMAMRAFEREGVTTDLRDLDSLAKDTFIENTKVRDVTPEELFDVFFAPYVDKELGIEHDIDTTSVSPQRRLQILGIGKYVED